MKTQAHPATRHLTAALCYTVLALTGGVFYREFTKALAYTGYTTLSGVYTHYFAMGMVFFLLLALLERVYPLTGHKHALRAIVTYHVGLNITVAGLIFRGVLQATGAVLSRGADASVSGVSGIGHAVLGVSLVIILFGLRDSARQADKAASLIQ